MLTISNKPKYWQKRTRESSFLYAKTGREISPNLRFFALINRNIEYGEEMREPYSASVAYTSLLEASTSGTSIIAKLDRFVKG